MQSKVHEKMLQILELSKRGEFSLNIRIFFEMNMVMTNLRKLGKYEKINKHQLMVIRSSAMKRAIEIIELYFAKKLEEAKNE